MKPHSLHNINELHKIYICKGVKLRPLNQSDATRILEILKADRSIRDKVTVASRLYTSEDVAEEIERYRKDTGLIRYVLLKNNDLIGLISLWRDDGFFDIPPNPNDYGFGFFLDPCERGRGLITLAVQSLMEKTVKNLYVRQFIAFCEDHNHESIAVLIRLGFEPTDNTFSEPDNGWVERKYIKRIVTTK